MSDILPGVLSGPYRGLDSRTFERKFVAPADSGIETSELETGPTSSGEVRSAVMPPRFEPVTVRENAGMPGRVGMGDYEALFEDSARYHRQVINVLRQTLSIPEGSYIHLTGSAIDLVHKLAEEHGVQMPEMPDQLAFARPRANRDPNTESLGSITFGTAGYGQGTSSVSITFNINTIGRADHSSLATSEVLGERDVPALKAELGETDEQKDQSAGILQNLPMAGGQTDSLHRILVNAGSDADDGGGKGNGKGNGSWPYDPRDHHGGPPPWAGQPHGPHHGSGPEDNSDSSQTVLALYHATGIYKDRQDIGLELFRKISLAVGG